MVISSRTPEGEPNRCPLCGKHARTDPSTVPTRDAPCPHCGLLLWFPETTVPRPSKSRARSYEGLILRLGKERLGPLPSKLLQPLLDAIDMLARQGRLPSRAELVCLVDETTHWSSIVDHLERQAFEGQHRWAYKLGHLVRKQFRRLLQRSPA